MDFTMPPLNQRMTAFVRDSLLYIFEDAMRRAQPMIGLLGAKTFLAALSTSPANAANTVPFQPIQTLTPQEATSVDQEGGSFDLSNWMARGMTIRGGDSVYQCLANLTVALEQVGQLNAAEYNGAAGALSLLPTAGALLGAPTRELWVVFKLVLLAGVLRMFLSLGGSITPSNVGDYDSEEPFSYGGFMPTTRLNNTDISRPISMRMRNIEDSGSLPKLSDVDNFADEVKARADHLGGGGPFLGVWVAMGCQVILVIALLVPMCYGQRGSVITWWCRVSVQNINEYRLFQGCLQALTAP